MKQRIICKTLAVAVILLFVGVGIQPAIAKTKDRINYSPDEPLIEGPIDVKPNVLYEWTFKARDPNRDDLYYEIDWDGDLTIDERVGPFPSGEEVKINHTYDFRGKVVIRARAVDIYGAGGEWGELILRVSVKPKDYLSDNGRFIIRCKARNSYDIKSSWGELVVKIPRARASISYHWYVWLFERLPMLERLLSLLL